MSVVKKLVHMLGSIGFTIVLICLFAVMVTIGTVIESKTGSHKIASRYIYGNPFFLLVLWGVFTNILFATFKRLPFKKRHIPFLITHLGLLMVFGGTLLKMSFGTQGTVTLKEGLSTDYMKVDDSYALSYRKKGENAWQQIPIERDWLGRLKTAYHDENLTVTLKGYQPHGSEQLLSWIKGDHLVVLGHALFPLDKVALLDKYRVIATRDPEKIKNELKELPALVFLEEPNGTVTALEVSEAGELRHQIYNPSKFESLYAYDEGFGGYSAPFSLQAGEIEAPITRKFTPLDLPQKAEEERPLIAVSLVSGELKDQLSLAYGSPLPQSALKGEFLFKFEPLRKKLPVRIKLKEAKTTFYPGTANPSGYEASIYANGSPEKLSMNSVWESKDGTRFYLANLSPLDESAVKEVRLVVNHDPFKWFLTYPGGVILALGIVLLLSRRKKVA